MSSRGAAFEYGIASAAFAIILAITLATQERIAVNSGRGYDGSTYYDVAAQLAADGSPTGASRFASRLGTPLLAARLNPDDLIGGFQTVNLSAAFASTLLLLAWLRRYLATPWLRLALVIVYASHWLQLLRFTVFYPVLVDACAQAWCFAGLNGIAAYEKAPSAGRLAAIAAIGTIGVAFREIVLLVPLAFLFSRSPQIAWLPRLPYLRLTNLPRLHEWIPLALATAAFATMRQGIAATDPGFSAFSHLLERALSRSALSYLLGWMVAFGPGIFLMLFDWRAAAAFFAQHRWALVYIGGVAAVGWAGSVESERHALNWGAPIAYLLIGLAIQRHLRWFRGLLLAVIVVSQALVSRVFWTIPQPADDYLQYTPRIVLTPLGSGTTYLHLFPDYLPRSLAWVQFWQYAALGGALLALMWWRAVAPASGRPASVRIRTAVTEARRSGVNAVGAAVWRLRQLGLAGAVPLLLTFVVVAAVAGTTLVTAYRAQPVRINVRWKTDVSAAERQALERLLHLAYGSRREGTTWRYLLTDPSAEGIRAIVRHPAVDDTAHVDRELFRPEAAREMEERARLLGMLIGLVVAIAVARARSRAAPEARAVAGRT